MDSGTGVISGTINGAGYGNHRRKVWDVAEVLVGTHVYNGYSIAIPVQDAGIAIEVKSPCHPVLIFARVNARRTGTQVVVVRAEE